MNPKANASLFYSTSLQREEEKDKVVADVGGGSGSGFWTLDFWGNVTNLIGVVILGMAVPVGKWLINRRAKILSEARKREDERIAEICKKQIDPMMDQLKDIAGKVSYMDDFFRNNTTFRDHGGDGYGGSGGGSPDDRGGSGRPQGGHPSNRRPRHRYDSYNRTDGYNHDSENGGSPFNDLR